MHIIILLLVPIMTKCTYYINSISIFLTAGLYSQLLPSLSIDVSHGCRTLLLVTNARNKVGFV